MKKYRWILIIATVMLSVFVLCGAMAENVPADVTVLQLEESQTVSVEDGKAAWFSFSPAEEGGYAFESLADGNAYAYLYENTDQGLQQIDYNAYGGTNSNFLIKHKLSAGRTYYLKAYHYNGSENVPVIVYPYQGLVAAVIGNSSWSVNYGTEVEFAVEASSQEGTVSYQWAKKDEYGLYQDVENATEDHLTVMAEEMSDAYICYITDGVSKMTKEFYVYGDDVLQATANETANQSASVSVPYGEDAVLKVVASSSSGFVGYQWYKVNRFAGGFSDMVLIEGANDSTLTVPDITESLSYQCIASSKNQSSRIDFAIYYDDPISLTASSFSLDSQAGKSVLLEAQAECATELTYEWYQYDFGLGTSVKIEGATGSSYRTEELYDSSRYHCQITNVSGDTTVQDFYVYLDGAPDISNTQAESLTVSLNQSATFNCFTLVGSPYTVSYQWYERIDYKWEPLTPIEGATNASYTIEKATQSGYYPCKITSSSGVETIQYNLLTIQNHFSISAAETSLSGKTGDLIEPCVTANASTGGFTYQWYLGDWTSYATGKALPINGATEASLQLTEQNEHRQSYICEVRDTYNTILTKLFDVVMSSNLTAYSVGETTQYVQAGNPVTLAVQATSDKEISYQWYKSTDSGTIPIEEEKQDSITIHDPENHAEYHCYIRDTTGKYQIIHYQIIVNSDLTAQAVGNASISVKAGEPIRMEVLAQGYGSLTYQWYKYKRDKYDHYAYVPVEGATDSTYATTELDYSGQTVQCVVEDSYGNRTSVQFWAYIDNQLYLTCEGNNTKVVSPGETAELKVNLTALDVNGVTFEWYKREYNLDRNAWGDQVRLNAASDTLTTDPANCYTEYYCIVRDRFGNSCGLALYIEIENNLAALADGAFGASRTLSVDPGASADLKVLVTATDLTGITYEWRKEYYDENGYWQSETLTDITGDSCTAGDINKRQTYVCTVRDRFGNSRLVYFYLQIDNALTVKPEGAESTDLTLKVLPGGTANMKVIVSAKDMSALTYKWYWQKYDPETQTSTSGMFDVTGDACSLEDVRGRSDCYCTVSDQYGNSQSAWFHILIDNALSVTIDGTEGEHYKSYSVDPGAQLSLKANVTANDMSSLTYRWQRNVYHAENMEWVSEEMTEVTGTEYNVDSISSRCSYVLFVRDQYNNEVQASFDITIDNHLAVWPEGAYGQSNTVTLYVKPGDAQDLVVNVSATDQSGMMYRWRRQVMDPDTYNWTGYEYLDITGPSLTVESLSTRTRYLCEVTDRYGNNGLAWFELYVDNQLSIKPNGSNNDTIRINVAPGGSAELSVLASALDDTELTYAWRSQYFNTETQEWVYSDLDATGTSMTASDVTRYTEYRCMVKDQYGNSAYAWFNIGIDNALNAWADGSTNQSQDYSMYVAPGENVQMKVNVSATDLSGMTYSWRRHSYDLQGRYWKEWEAFDETGDTVIVENVDTRMEYECTVRDRYGNYKTVWFYVYIDNALTACVAGENNNYKDLFWAQGESLQLAVNVSASDMTGLTWYWEKGVYEAERDDWNWEQLDHVAGYEVSVSDITGWTRYVFSVYDVYGNSAGVTFNITVDNHFSVEIAGEGTDYKSYDKEPGESHEMAVSVKGDDLSGLTYSWWGDAYDPDTGVWEYVNLGSVKEDHYSLNDIRGAANYYCEVRDRFGNTDRAEFCFVINNRLSVLPEGSAESYKDIDVEPGADAALKVIASATDESVLKYQWSVRTKNPTEDWYYFEAIPGATGDTYLVEDVRKSARYKCSVTDRYGSIAQAYFNISIDNGFRASRVGDYSTFVPYGEAVRMEVSASCKTGELTYVWYRTGNNEGIIPGATSAVYEIPEVSTAGEYYCRVSDQYGNEQDIWFRVSIDNQFKAKAKGSTNLYISSGESATLEVEASCLRGNISYTWYRRDLDSDYREISGANGTTCSTGQLNKSAQFYCRVCDEFDNSMNVGFDVYIDNQLTVRSVGATERLVPVNGTATLAVTASCLEGNLTYQWYCMPLNGYAEQDQMIAGATAAAYTTPSLTTHMEYWCQVSDQYGNRTNEWFYVYCSDTDQLPAPTITVTDSSTLGKNVTAEIAFSDDAARAEVEFGYLNEKGEFVGEQWYALYPGENTITIPGHLITMEGTTYQIRAVATVFEPWNEMPHDVFKDSEWAVKELTFTAAAIPECPEVVMTGETEVTYNDDIEIRYTISGAEAIAYKYTTYNPETGEEISWSSNEETEGETGIITWMSAGRNEITFYAKMNGVWSKASTKTYSILVRPLGYLEVPTVMINGEKVSDSLTYAANKVPTFEVICEHANGFDSGVYRVDDDGDRKWLDGEWHNGSSVHVNLANWLHEPGEYVVEFDPWAEGYIMRGSRKIHVTITEVELGNLLNLPAALTRIESEAFAGLTNVDTIRIPATVRYIANDAFSGMDISILAEEGSYAARWGSDRGYYVILE